MPLDKPLSKPLVDLEWARVYADRIEDELKLIRDSLVALNGHVTNPQILKGALTLRAQMKLASKQVGLMKEISSEIENHWRNTIEQALRLKARAAQKGNRRKRSAPRG